MKTVKKVSLIEQSGTQFLPLPVGSMALEVRPSIVNGRGYYYAEVLVTIPSEVNNDTKIEQIPFYLVAEDGLVPIASTYVGKFTGHYDVWYVFQGVAK